MTNYAREEAETSPVVADLDRWAFYQRGHRHRSHSTSLPRLMAAALPTLIQDVGPVSLLPPLCPFLCSGHSGRSVPRSYTCQSCCLSVLSWIFMKLVPPSTS